MFFGQPHTANPASVDWCGEFFSLWKDHALIANRGEKKIIPDNDSYDSIL